MKEVIQGPAGTAERIVVVPLKKDREATLASWFCTLPGQSPAWSHYQISGIHLRDIPGVSPAHKDFPDAEYEVMIVALDPDRKPRADDVETLVPLRPINYRRQFHGVDDEAVIGIVRRLVEVAVAGDLPVEMQGIQGAREAWDEALVAACPPPPSA